MFTEKVEQAKKELSPLMQEVRKYIPQAEYGYHVVSGEYPAFYGVRIEFTYNGIRFHVYRINKENKYRIATDMEHFEYVNRYDIERAGNQYEKPCNIGVFTAKKINDWINYCTQIYRQVEQENAENARKVRSRQKLVQSPEPASVTFQAAATLWHRTNVARYKGATAVKYENLLRKTSFRGLTRK